MSDYLQAVALWHRYWMTLPETMTDAMIDAVESWADVWQ